MRRLGQFHQLLRDSVRGCNVSGTPTGLKMASNNSDVHAQSLGQFHPKYSGKLTLSKDRRIASGGDLLNFSTAFSNDPILIGQKFSVKILQSSRWVRKSNQCILQTSPIRRTLHGCMEVLCL